MPLKKSIGNMYEFVSHMWGPVRGKCEFDCKYCYVKKWGELPEIHLDEKDLKSTNLGENNFIFICHTVDLFAPSIPEDWILKILEKLNRYSTNKYLLQSKNPKRMLDFIDKMPSKVILGTTIETNRDISDFSKAPPVKERAEFLKKLKDKNFETMITIEPVLDFDIDELINLIIFSSPKWVNIGADSKNHNLPEPSKEKIKGFIKKLEEKTDVKLKSNIKRLL